MTFLQLEYFSAVARLGSISRVAEQYNISPAALSRSISQLERELGVELFDHEGRSIVLNNNGSIFLQYAIEVLDSMFLARQRLSDPTLKRVVRARFDVLLDEPGELPIAFKLARPDTLVEMIPPHASTTRYDVRFFATLDVIDNPSYELICSERFVAALPASHPLASAESIHLAELRDELFVVFKYDQHERTIAELCGECGFTPRIGLSFGMTAHSGLYRAISENLGCSIVPERVSRAGWDPDKVALVPFSDVHRIRHIYATTPDGGPFGEGARFVVDAVRSRLLP